VFNDEEAMKKICVWKLPSDYEMKLISRVKNDGEKAVYEGIHIPRFEHCRKMLYDDMIEAGYDEALAKLWCFGLRKHYDDILKDNIINNDYDNNKI